MVPGHADFFRCCLAGFCGLFFLVQTAAANSIFDTVFDKNVGARPIAMGRAFLGQADDASAIFINPAGLATVRTLLLTNMYSTSPVNDASFLTLAFAAPAPSGGEWGCGYNNITQPNVTVSSETVNYTQQALVIFFANKYNEKLSLGGELKFFAKGPSKDISPSTTGQGANFDLSLKYRGWPWIDLGANVQNILPEGLGGKITLKNGQIETLTTNLRLGISARVLGEQAAIRKAGQQTLKVNFDAEKNSISPYLFHLGLEWWPNWNFAVRGGLDQTGQLGSSQVMNNLTAGFGLKYNGITFDYAYYLPDLGGQSEQYFSIGFIGPSQPTALTKEATPELRQTAKLKHYTDVPAGFWAREAIEKISTLYIIPGYADGKFRPEAPVSQKELAEFLRRADPARNFVINGKAGTNCTRAVAVVAVARLDGLSPARVLEAPFADVGGRFKDVALITAAREKGLLDFFGTKLEPQKAVSRAELAAMLYRTNLIQKQLQKYDFVL